MSDEFVRDLEEELVAAARFRAAHPRRRFALPRARVAPRRLLAGALVAGAAAALAIAAVVALSREGEQRIAGEPPQPSVAFALPAMAPAPACGVEPALDRPAADDLPPMAIFDRAQHEPDGMPVGPDALPVSGFVPHESRRPGVGQLKTELTLVPARGVRRDGACPRRGDDGPGLCIVAGLAQPPEVRCFTATDIAAGRAAVQTGPSLVAGVVPDGVAEVALTWHGRSVTAAVVENAYEAIVPGVTPGAQIALAMRRGTDCRTVASELRERVTALYEPAQPGLPIPRPAMAAIEDAGDFDAIVLGGARYWGGEEGVDFWVVPAVARGAGECSPATEVCVVAVAGGSADAVCGRGPDSGTVQWRLSPSPSGRAAIFGFVPDRTTAVDVRAGDRAGEVEARLNVFGGVLPFPLRADAAPHPQAVHEPIAGTPRIGVVDAGGDADAIAYRLSQAGYGTAGVTAGVTPQEPTTVHWRPGRVAREDIARIAALAGAEERKEIDDPERTPRPVQDADAPVVVVVGTG